MPQSLSRVYIHIVFSTKTRLPLIDDSISSRLFEYIGGIAKGLNCNPNYCRRISQPCTRIVHIKQAYNTSETGRGIKKAVVFLD